MCIIVVRSWRKWVMRWGVGRIRRRGRLVGGWGRLLGGELVGGSLIW